MVRRRDKPDLRTRGLIRVGLLLSAAIAVAVVTLTVLLAGDVHAPLGDQDPGLVTSLGATLLRLSARLASAVCLGALVFAAFCTPAAPTGGVTADGYAALRTAARAAVCWAVSAALLVPFSAADLAGRPVTMLADPEILWGLVDALEEPTAWLVVLVCAVVVAVGTRWTLSWRPVVGLTAIAAFGVLVPVVVGHAAVGAWHDVATNAMLWHALAAAVWLGTLVALLLHVRRGGTDQEPAIRRYHRLSLGCLVVLGGSGVISGLIGARPEGLLTTGYGLLVVGKALILIGLVAITVVLRRRWRGRLSSDDRRPVAPLLLVEVLVLGLAAGVSVASSRLVLPAFLLDPASIMETLIGYELLSAPDLAGMVLGWRLNLVVGVGALAGSVLYLLGVRRLHRRGDRWPLGRTAAWIGGCLVVLVATSSGLGRFAPGAFSVHMATHMTLNMLAPVLLVLGGPITLALRALPTAGEGRPPGPREWLVALSHSRAARLLLHPVTASVVFIGSLFGLYFTGLFDAAMPEHWAHQLMTVHFLVSGYVFYWLVIGVDRPPRPLPHLARLGMLFAAMPFHAFFGVLLMSRPTLIGEMYYRRLDVPWVPDLLADQRLGGGIAWVAGEVPMVIVLIALLIQWSRQDDRDSRRHDRRDGAERGADGELDSYNAMLAALADRRD
ncbi:putative copper resistance protein D [Actinoalloteichus hoggarensis]|uniref:Cytochrome c oxidase caa3 assembly factor (Caa3_CtaG) n=1 Tax=Actinoalloteichus hoggarensis TaxID=1470176 RepID=A0A221W4C6_9PSEU|nr:cytochrome c oxidase assembly protein [Actinoalloteichus hoggarensis]ASO20705.1 Cytochrome c oxidase caa3 assembly factor (Caa3_CtaG) [Actinoalloteichus hoggarensis]MBB5924441.1 putative copper resistance protein D [Actinoalloteichus hoggarensis]